MSDAPYRWRLCTEIGVDIYRLHRKHLTFSRVILSVFVLIPLRILQCEICLLLTTLPTVTCVRYILNCLRSFPQQTRLGRHGDSRLRGVGVSVHAIRVEQSFDRTFRFQLLSIHEALRLPVRPDTFSNFSSVSPCVQPAVLALGSKLVHIP